MSIIEHQLVVFYIRINGIQIIIQLIIMEQTQEDARAYRQLMVFHTYLTLVVHLLFRE